MQAEKQALMTRQIVGHSQSIKKILLQIEKLSMVDSTVLVTGESGVGKSLVAEVIHGSGPMGNSPLIKIDCTQLDKVSIEKEVLSVFQPPPCVKPDNNPETIYCNLLLEEVGEVSLQQQRNLLRLLEERQIHWGSGQDKRSVNLRIIATTHRNLNGMVSQGQFRKDLYYRLRVTEIKVPVLKAHSEDIPALVNHFIERYNQVLNRNVAGVSPGVLKLLSIHPWFGNVRELQHVVEQAMVFSDKLIIERDLFCLGLGITEKGNDGEMGDLKFALKTAAGNKALAARLLGVSRRTIYLKIEEYGISD